jgi:hypothetical protein
MAMVGRSINLSLKSDIQILLKESDGDFSFAELLSDLFDLVTKLIEFDVPYRLPSNLDGELISKINIKLENIFSDLEDAEEQIRDREFSTFDGDFKVVGKLPKKNFKLFSKEILENHIQDNWDFERDIVDLLEKHFPELRLKNYEY